MAMAYQCDRCKNFYNVHTHNTNLKVSRYGIAGRDFKVYVDVDLCPSCAKELEEFLHIQEDKE